MRPVLLHAEGFGVFREAVDIDFDGVDYFALVGPTGAGKSTVIDAICFALYGSVPRYGDERQVARVVSVGKLETKVSLTFAIGTERYRATRVVRVRNGKASTPEAILEHLDPEGRDGRMLAGSASQLKPAVEQLLGLPFAHFTKCVVLPQGDFARFLHDEPAKRRDLLTRLLDLEIYDKVGQLARQRAAAAKHAVAIHQQTRDALAGATDAARQGARMRLDGLRALHKTLDADRPEDEARAATIATAEAAMQRATDLAARLEAVTVPEDAARLTQTLAAAATAARAAAEASTESSRALAEQEEQLDSLPDRSLLERARDTFAELASLDETFITATEHAEAAARDAARVAEIVAAADTHLAEARAALDALRDAHAAHALRAHLVAGEPCPVCEQTVESVPKRSRPAALRKAETAVTEARRIADEARAAVDATNKSTAAAAARLAQLAERRSVLVEITEELRDEYPDADSIAAELARVAAVTRAHAAARKRERDARAVAADAASRVETLDRQLDERWAAHRRQRDEFLLAGLVAPGLAEDLVTSWRTLQAWSVTAREEQRARAAEARSDADAAHNARAAAFATQLDAARELGVETKAENLAALRDAVIEHGQNARNEVQRIDDAIEQSRKLEHEIRIAREEHEVAEMLGVRLRSDRFEKWLLVEALDSLVQAASALLFDLSAGNFSLRSSDDDEFVVVDHRNAEETRSVRTLSGGETFQASLALALALSDQLAELSAVSDPKLEAIFLDEGFGTLDADALETVAGTIESLGTSARDSNGTPGGRPAGRMVGIVTHVPALAERVPVRYRVSRTDTSARVEREDV